MKTFLAICVLAIAGCSSHIAFTEKPGASATLTPALCESGEPAVTLWQITSLRTGETYDFPWGKGAHADEVYLRPGRYEVEAGCNRGKDACGILKGWLHMDGAPTTRLSVQAGNQVTIDCDASNAALVVRR